MILELTKALAFGFWTGLYLFAFGIPITLIITRLQAGNADSIQIMLLGFALGLTAYFWIYDLLFPGLKVDPNMRWYGFVLGFATVVSLIVLALTAAYGNLLEYTFCLSTVYVMKALWHRSTKSSVDTNDYESLHLAILTDAVACVILGIVGFTWRAVLSTVTPDMSQVFSVMCITVALEAHYHLVRLWVLRKNRSSVIPPPPPPSSSTFVNKAPHARSTVKFMKNLLNIRLDTIDREPKGKAIE